MTSLRSSFQPTLERDTIEFTRDETGPVFSQREGTMAAQVQWHLSGDYFENCNCSVVCPCLVSKAPPLTSRPTEGVCDVGVIFHIEDARPASTWPSQFTLQGRWAKVIGRSAPTSTNVPTNNKR